VRPFRFGLQAGRVNDPHAWTVLARRAESEGYSAFMIPDHLGRLATFPLLMAAAAVTRSIKLTTYVLNQDFRAPPMLAVEAATVQLLTGGRLELGVGAGWAEWEYVQAGLRYDPAPERVARFDEYLQVVKDLLHAEAPLSFDGKWYTLREFQPLPRSAEYGPPPILVGGGSKHVLSTAGRLAEIISISTRATPDSRIDSRNITLAQVEHKLAWIRAAAGARFADIELNMTIRDVTITDDRRAAARQLLAGWRSGRTMMANADALTEDDVLDSPHIAIGTTSQIVEQFTTMRDKWGISYYEINNSDMESIAPVVERMAH
jgi:probable F420-dependent oxidoreductase